MLDSDQFKSAVESIGMDFSRIKGVGDLPDWASGKRYSFVYGGSPYIVYELGNGEIDSITTDNNKRFKIYERGYKPLDYRDFELDWGTVGLLQSDMMERLSKYIIGATSVKNKIGSISYSRAYNYYSLSGEVKAKNAVDKKDFTFTVDYMLEGNGYKCVYLALDGAVAFGSGESPELPKEEIVQEDKSGGGMIVLSYGKEGQYGQTDSFGGDSYIRYYIPAGSYKVKCNIRGGFYIETIALHKEEGYDISDIIRDVRVSEGDEVDIVVSDGECISLIINTEIELTKK